MENLSKYVDGPARLLMCILFVMSGLGKLTHTAYIQQYMEAYSVPGILVWPAAALEIVGGIMLVVGFKVRLVGTVFSFWCLLTAAIFHTKFSDQMQQLMFMKNLTMAGGFLMLAKTGSDGMSIDGRTD